MTANLLPTRSSVVQPEPPEYVPHPRSLASLRMASTALISSKKPSAMSRAKRPSMSVSSARISTFLSSRVSIGTLTPTLSWYSLDPSISATLRASVSRSMPRAISSHVGVPGGRTERKSSRSSTGSLTFPDG